MSRLGRTQVIMNRWIVAEKAFLRHNGRLGDENMQLEEAESKELDAKLHDYGRVKEATKQIGILNFQRFFEFVLTGGLAAAEVYFDAGKYPEHYAGFGVTPENAPLQDITPETTEFLDSMGDIMEIGVGSGAIRFSLAVVEQIVKTQPVKDLVRNTVSHVGMKKVLTRIFGLEKTEELAESGEIKMSDDSQFWAAIVPWTIIKAIHSLGLVSLGANDHIGAPMPSRLIGQVFAVATLVGLHYGVKNAEEIKQMTSQVFDILKNDATHTIDQVETNLYMAKFGVEGLLSDANHAVANMGKKVDNLIDRVTVWKQNMQRFDPDKVIPRLDEVAQNWLAERIEIAVEKIAMQHELDKKESKGE